MKRMDRARAIDPVDRFLLATLFVGVFSLYWTVVPKMAREWWDDPNYSHGLVVPLFAAYLVWERRGELVAFRDTRSSFTGPAFVLAGAIMLIVGKAGGEFFSMRSSLVLVTAGLFRTVFGEEGFRKCLFPLCFLFFMVPIPYILYDAAAFPLKMIASWIGEHSLDFIGVPVLRDGNIISLPNIQLEVADACSGIRSLMSLLALATATAYFLHLGLGKGLVLFLSAVPTSVGTNSLRIIVTGILSYRFGQRAAEGFFHEFSGWVVFIAGALLIFLFGLLLRTLRSSR